MLGAMADQERNVPTEATPGTPATEPVDTTAVSGADPEDAWRQGIHLVSSAEPDADSTQLRSGYWDDEDEPEGPDAT